MMEFGARLTLKDGMLATMQKNIKAQREFTEQVNRANASVKALGGAKANPTIKAEDRATGIVNSIKNTLSTVNGATATANVDVDERTAKKKVDAILEKIRELKKTAVSPVVRLKETVTSKAEKISKRLISGWIPSIH